MFKLIELLRSKPSDRNIRVIRVIFALILLGVIYFGFAKTYFEYSVIPKEVLYVLYIFPIIGLLRGVLDPGVWRKKIWKWTQVGFGLLLMITSFFFIDTDTSITGISSIPSTSNTLSAIATPSPSGNSTSSVDTDFWIGFLGFWLALGGLVFASKNITAKNERYGEKVKKIRV